MLCCLQCVVTAKVRGFPHLGHRVGVGAAAFANDERHQLDHAFFEQIGAALERRGALGRGHPGPRFERLAGARDAEIELLGRGGLHRPARLALAVGADSLLQAVQHVA